MSARTVRLLCDVGRDGTSARKIAVAARDLGFAAQGHSVSADDVEALADLPLPVIAHFNDVHYVVVKRIDRDVVRFMDPALGHRREPIDAFARMFSGIAIEVVPDEVKPTADEGPRWAHLRAVYVALLRDLRWWVVGGLLTTAALQVFALLTPFVTANIVAAEGLTLPTLVGMVAASAVAFAVAALARGRLLLEIKIRHDEKVATNLVEHLVDLPLEYFQGRSAGDLVGRVGSTQSMRDALSAAAVTSIVDAAMATLSLVVLAVIDPVLEIAALAVIAILLATPILGFLWIRVHSLTQLDRRSVGTARLITLLLGIEQAKAHSAEDAFVASWRENYAEELDAARRIGGIEVRLQTISDGCRLLAAPLFVVIAAASAPNAAVAVGIGLAGVAFVAPISNLSRTIVSVLALQGHVARIDDVLEEPPEDHLDVALDHDPVPVVIDRVTYRYAGADRAAVADVSAAIAPGSTVLVAGRSGSGKSTLARLVAGLLLPSAGEIRMRDDERRPRVGYVAQSISLFPGTLLSNVTFGREAPDEEVARALHGADLTEFVASLPMGLATNVIDAGPTFSGGQRQRIAIARALLNSPALLILDEATSNLDPESEARIVERFGAFSATKIVVAHRPAVLAAVDQVVYLENGCVAGIGTHEELMATEGYARLWAEPRVRML